jgi:dUTP pyrophosphatase
MNMQVKIKQLHPNAKMPTYATDGSGAFDLYAATVDGFAQIGKTVTHGAPVLCDTGLAFEIPESYGMFILSRSGHGFKFDTRLSNAVGLADADFRGSVQVKLTCDQDRECVPDLFVKPGDRIAQAVILPIPRVAFEWADELTSTDRGANGFGSTGA